MTVSASQAKWHAGGGPLERPVRQRAGLESSWWSWRSDLFEDA